MWSRGSWIPRIPAGGLKRFFPDAHIYDLGTVQGEMQTLDSIDGLTVIDFRAGLVGPSLRSLNKNRFLDEVGAGALNLVIMHVIGPNDQSVAEIAEVAELVGAAKHIIVKNHIDGELGGWSANDRFSASLRAMEPATINVPHLAADACDAVDRLAVPFDRFIEDSAQSRILRGYVRTWLDAVFAEFDRVGLGEIIASATR